MSYPPLGKCCVCNVEGPQVRNILLLNKRHPDPVPPVGCWGCPSCGLPTEGVIAVLCNDCVKPDRATEFVCSGAPSENKRLPVAGLAEFRHDMTDMTAHAVLLVLDRKAKFVATPRPQKSEKKEPL